MKLEILGFTCYSGDDTRAKWELKLYWPDGATVECRYFDNMKEAKRYAESEGWAEEDYAIVPNHPKDIQSYELIATNGYGVTVWPEHPEVKKALETKKMTTWVGGHFGIVDDWGTAVEKNVKRIIINYTDLTSEVIYERPSRNRKK